jgi:putative radical SAM enzyme (TIGR03279 family)
VSRGGYGVPHAAGRGGIVSAVTPDGPASRAGIVAGETVMAVDDTELRDVIDWQWLTTDSAFDVLIRGADGSTRHVAVERGWDEPVGVEFADTLFDGVRECDNACSFCFVSQLPEGLRDSLYVRDDDYRLSFLSGNFVTLTNVTDEDVERIVSQRLSPMHVSVHAVDADARRVLVCASAEDRALEHLDTLSRAGIEAHVQIVLVPGVNDGTVLDETLGWLSEHAGVLSVGVVPLGFTRHQKRFTVSYDDAASAARVLEALAPWRARMASERAVRWVHAADELYLAAERPMPSADEYDDFPQYENGIGLVRAFEDEWAAAVGGVTRAGPGAPVLVTGTLFAPVLERLVALAGIEGARVLAVTNRSFGGNVSVAGLLCASDLASAIRDDVGSVAAHGLTPGPYLVPDVVLNTDGVTLDDVAEADLAATCGADVRVVSSDAAGLLAGIFGTSGNVGGRG